MRILGIIPARKGSKGVPGKNIYPIAGKPLIGYTIDTAVRSSVLANIVISTDDEAIWEYAAGYNVTIHKRDAALATDTSPVVLTILEVIHFAEQKFNTQYDAVMLLQATAPLRELWHLEEAIALLETHNDYDCLISVVKTGDNHPARMYTIDDGILHSLQPENEDLNRQQLPPVYLRNGSIYITRRNALLENKKVMLKPALAYIMDEKYYLNIDGPKDLMLAKIIMEGHGNRP